MRTAQVVGGALLATSALLAWIQAPLSGSLPSSAARLSWALALLAFLAAARKSPGLGAVAGVSALALSGYTLVELAIADPLLWRLVDENEQYAQIVQFSKSYLPANYGFEAEFGPEVAVQAPLARLTDSVRFLGRGPWVCAMAGLLLLLPGLWIRPRRVGASLLVAAPILSLAAAAALGRPLVALLRVGQADRYVAFGRYFEAIRSFERARQLSPQAWASEQVLLRLGESYATLGLSDRPAAQLFDAHRDLEAGRTPAASAKLRLLVESAPQPYRRAGARLLARTQVERGLELYREGHIATAVAQWEMALESDPTQMQAAFFLTRGDYDLARYEASIDMCGLLLSNVRNPIVRGSTEGNLGDSLTRLGRTTEARLAYDAARRLDSRANFRIIKSLGGT